MQVSVLAIHLHVHTYTNTSVPFTHTNSDYYLKFMYMSCTRVCIHACIHTYTLMHAYTPTSIYTLRVLPRLVARTLVMVPDCNQSVFDVVPPMASTIVSNGQNSFDH